MSRWLARGLALVDAATRASRAAGLPALRVAFMLRLGQALLLLAASWPLASAEDAGWGLLCAMALAVLLEAAAPGAVLAAAEPARSVHRWPAVGAALTRGGLVGLALLLAPGLAAAVAAGLEDAGDRVVVALFAAPIAVLGATGGLILAARTGPATLEAARGAGSSVAVRRSLGRSVHLLPQLVLVGAELLAAGVATTALGLLEPAAVLERPWSDLVGAELEAAALWRLLGAPLVVFSVFAHAATLAAASGQGELGERGP